MNKIFYLLFVLVVGLEATDIGKAEQLARDNASFTRASASLLQVQKSLEQVDGYLTRKNQLLSSAKQRALYGLGVPISMFAILKGWSILFPPKAGDLGRLFFAPIVGGVTMGLLVATTVGGLGVAVSAIRPYYQAYHMNESFDIDSLYAERDAVRAYMEHIAESDDERAYLETHQRVFQCSVE